MRADCRTPCRQFPARGQLRPPSNLQKSIGRPEVDLGEFEPIVERNPIKNYTPKSHDAPKPPPGPSPASSCSRLPPGPAEQRRISEMVPKLTVDNFRHTGSHAAWNPGDTGFMSSGGRAAFGVSSPMGESPSRQMRLAHLGELLLERPMSTSGPPAGISGMGGRSASVPARRGLSPLSSMQDSGSTNKVRCPSPHAVCPVR